MVLPAVGGPQGRSRSVWQQWVSPCPRPHRRELASAEGRGPEDMVQLVQEGTQGWGPQGRGPAPP